MPITPTFPGIYIEELPSNAHSVTAAPTSVTVFGGYTHPFKTLTANWGKAIEIFSYLEYEQQFGGMYTSGTIESHVAYAVNQFFLNGGSNAWIVALQPHYFDPATTPPTDNGVVTGAVLPVGGAQRNHLHGEGADRRDSDDPYHQQCPNDDGHRRHR